MFSAFSSFNSCFFVSFAFSEKYKFLQENFDKKNVYYYDGKVRYYIPRIIRKEILKKRDRIEIQIISKEESLTIPLGGPLLPSLRGMAKESYSIIESEHCFSTANCGICNFFAKVADEQLLKYESLSSINMNKACSENSLRNVVIEDDNFIPTVCTCPVHNAFENGILYNFIAEIMEIKFRSFTTDNTK